MSTALSLATHTAAIIKVTTGPNRGDNYKITPPGAIIGRDPNFCKIVLNDLRVSRQQCRIDFHPSGITLKDVSGKGTTYVNKQQIDYVTLQDGDIINVGDSTIIYEIYNPAGEDLVTSQNIKESKKPKKELKNKKPLFIFIAIILFIVGFLLYPTSKPQPPKEVATEQDTDKAIEEVIERQQELKKADIDLERKYSPEEAAKIKYSKRKSEEHFIRGFRDYQNHRYGRALEAFQTSLATDPSNKNARRYYQLAEKKRQDVVDLHMDLGNKYKQKSMYKMCIAEFEKVLQIINQPSDKKYKLAKEQIVECRLSEQRGQ